MNDARTNGQPQGKPIDAAPRHAADPTESDGGPEVRLRIPPVTRNDPPQSRTRWLSRRRLLGLAGALVLVVGAGILYWGANSGFEQTGNMQTNVEFMPISPRVSGPVARVFVDAREGTVLIDFSAVPPDTSRPASSAAQQPRGYLRDQVGALSEARGTCAPEPSAGTVPAAHVAGRPSDLSR